MSDIFISHSEEDADLALEIALALEGAGYSTWCFEVDSIPGVSHLKQTEQVIDGCRVMVVLVSPHSVQANRVNNEVMRGFEAGKRFVPLLRGITHKELVQSKAVFHQATGDTAWIYVPIGGAAPIMDRIVKGLEETGVNRGPASQDERLALLRSALLEWRDRARSTNPNTARGWGDPASTQDKEAGFLRQKPGLAVFSAEAKSSKVDRKPKRTGKWHFALIVLACLLVVGGLGAVAIIVGIVSESSPPTVVFSDNFSDETSGWDTFADSSGQALYTDGVLELTSYASGGACRSLLHATYTDFAMEVETSFVGGDSSQTFYGICFQLDDGTYWDWLISPSARFLITTPSEDHPDDFINGTWYGVILEGTGVTNNIRIDYVSGTVSFSCNGTNIYQYLTGAVVNSIGLVAICRDGGSAVVSFDNVVIITT